ncbi:MAG: hypothetical protein Q9187_002038 [Circinaria calcarea]
MSQRYVRFNVTELASLAAKAVGSKSCVAIQKYPDGMYNKALLMTMEDGKQVVAKVPNPNAGRAHFTIASEVATLEFARNILGTPVPKVFAWNSRAQNNPVGAEYIIMEKPPGISLDEVWPKMDIRDRFTIVKAIALYQKAWMSVSFTKFGSLYYAQDLDEEHSPQSPLYIDQYNVEVTNPKYAIGPSTGREFIDAGRLDVNFDRGPWATLEDFLSAIGHREEACVKSLPRLPKSSITLRGPTTYQPSREKKLKALQCYHTIVKYLLPTDLSITSSYLWHSDLHIGNIFVSPENPPKIIGIIDWQSSELAPLFFHARKPNLLNYEGPPLHGLERPRLPQNLAQLDLSAQKEATTLYLNISLCALYRALLHKQIPRLYRAMDFQETLSFDLLVFARNLLVDGEATYLAQIVELERTWKEIPGVLAHGSPAYPFCFSEEEKAIIETDFSGAMRGMELMGRVRETLADLFPERGIVRAEQYEESKDALRQMKEEVIKMFVRSEHERRLWEENWPFDD